MLIETFITNIARRLRDVGKKQWDDDFLLSATNAAISALCRSMPQVYTVNRDLILKAGTEQNIDFDLHKIVTILHNVKSDGSSGRAITKADMGVLDAACPQWRQDAPREYIRHWMVDEFDESRFYVWPPAEAQVQAVVADTTDAVVLTPVDQPGVEPVDPGELGDGAIPSARWDVNSTGSSGNSTLELSDDATVATHTSGENYVNIGVTENGIHDSGKYYFEFENPTDNLFCLYGFYTDVNVGSPLNISFVGGTSTSYGYQTRNGAVYNNGSITTYALTVGAGTRIFNRIDFDTGVWEMSINGTSWVVVRSDIPAGAILGVSISDSADALIVTDAASFEGTIPDGYEPLSVSVTGVVQAEVDAYQAALAQYSIDLQAYSDYQDALAAQDDAVVETSTVTSPGHTIRGTFTKTPRIDTAEPPTVPDEPVAPTGTSVEPVDPGPVSDGFPSSDTTPVISSYTPLGPFGISALNPSNGGSLIEQYWAVDTPEYIPDEQLVIVDFSNFDRRAMADDDVIRLNLTLSPTSGSLSLFNYFYRDSIPGYGEGSNPNYIRAKTIVDAIADGRPFAVLHHTSANTTTMRSGFVASVDDIPTFGTIPGIIDTNDAVATYAADSTGVEDFGATTDGEMTRNNANLSNENYPVNTKDTMYAGYSALPAYSYVRLMFDENMSNADTLLSGGQLVIANGDDTQELRYNITFQQPGNPGTLKYHTSQPPVTINDGPLEQYLWLDYQAT